MSKDTKIAEIKPKKKKTKKKTKKVNKKESIELIKETPTEIAFLLGKKKKRWFFETLVIRDNEVIERKQSLNNSLPYVKARLTQAIGFQIKRIQEKKRD